MDTFYKNYVESRRLTPDLTTTASTLISNQEGIGNFISSIGDFFLKKVNDIKGVFGINAKNDLKAFSKEAKMIYKEFSSLDSVVKRVSSLDKEKYDLIKGVKVPWIPGVDTDLPTLLSGIEVHVNEINSVAIPLLEEVDTYISKVAGEDSYRLSTVPNKDLVKKLNNYTKGTTGYLTSIINGKKLLDFKEFQDVVPNLGSIGTCHDILKGIIVNKEVGKVQEIFNKSESLGVRSKELYETLQSESIQMSKIRVNELVDVLKASAQLVTDVAGIIRILDASGRVHLSVCGKIANLK